MSPAECVCLKSPAKVNLNLCVLGLRADGYHEIDTWMQQVSLYDRLWICPARRGIYVGTDHPGVPAGKENLIYRAAAALRSEAGKRPLGASIRLEKRIPVAAGLGGGSGNAALTLWALNRLWGCRLGGGRLRRLAAAVGSDVPFFLDGPSARCRGRGETLSSRPPLKRGWILIVAPPFSLSTARVYGWMRAKLKSGAGRAKIRTRHPGLWSNDLEPIVFERYPEIRSCLDLLLEGGARQALMSGSGPACFGLFGRLREAEAAAERFHRRRGWAVHLVRPLGAPVFPAGRLPRFSGWDTR